MGDKEFQCASVHGNNGTETGTGLLEPSTASPDVFRVQLAVQLHHQLVEHVVRQILECHVEFQHIFISLISSKIQSRMGLT